tara:strand:+ start:747 stop:1601 length:855 start_codon:yes stop_codon:yes gene_type:complete
MEKQDDRYLWESEKEESFPKIKFVQFFVGLTRLFFFLPFTLSLIPMFLVCKFLYKKTGIKIPMLTVRQFWSFASLRLFGLRLRVQGKQDFDAGILVCNHVSWLDILAIQSSSDVVFVAKSEVKTWPGLGFLAKLADTLFVERKPQKIEMHSREAEEIILTGETLCFFPEGTSSDGLRVLKFRSGFFQLAYNSLPENLTSDTHIQPLSLFYLPNGTSESKDFYGWWGSMSLFAHIVKVLCLSSGSIQLKFHTLISSNDYPTRKHLAKAAETVIRNEIECNIKKSN